MKKNVYSLVLADDVIKAVDNEAYRLNTSRSNLINQILAQRLSCITPEMRMREIFNSFSQLLDDCFKIQSQNSDSLVTVKTALQYKYNPTVNYKIELIRAPDDYIGLLKVHIRTQNSSLIAMFDNFFTFWSSFENKLLSDFPHPEYSASLIDGKFVRYLFNSSDATDTVLGNSIYSYVRLLDKALKLYFLSPSDFNSNLPVLTSDYFELLSNMVI